MAKELMSLKTLSAKTGISVSTLRKFIQTKGMPHFNTGRKVFVNYAEFSEWFEKNFRQIGSGVGNRKFKNELRAFSKQIQAISGAY